MKVLCRAGPSGPSGISCVGGNWRGVGCFRIRKKLRRAIPPGACGTPAPWAAVRTPPRFPVDGRGVSDREEPIAQSARAGASGEALRAAIGPRPPRRDTCHPRGCVCVSFRSSPLGGERHKRRFPGACDEVSRPFASHSRAIYRPRRADVRFPGHSRAIYRPFTHSMKTCQRPFAGHLQAAPVGVEVCGPFTGSG